MITLSRRPHDVLWQTQTPAVQELDSTAIQERCHSRRFNRSVGGSDRGFATWY